MLLYCERFDAQRKQADLDVAAPANLEPLWSRGERRFDDADPRSMLRMHATFVPRRGFREGVWYDVPLEMIVEGFDLEEVPPEGSVLYRADLISRSTTGPLDAASMRVARTEGESVTPHVDVPPFSQEPLELRVVGCGQGNWNEVVGSSFRLIYDFGGDARWSRRELADFISGREIALEKRSVVVVLSHWDVDHYHGLLGATEADLSSISALVAPGPTPGNATCSRTLERVRRLKVPIWLMGPAARPGSAGRRIVLVKWADWGIVEVFRAVPGASRNQTGIVLRVRGSDKHALLTGDHHHEKLFDVIANSLPGALEYVVPHHGGRAGVFSVKCWSQIPVLNASFSFGLGNPYGHPLDGIEQAICRVASTVFKTESVKSYTTPL